VTVQVKLDHSVVHVSDRARSDAFYRDVLGAELIQIASVHFYRFGTEQLSVHGPGLDAKPVARIPVPPGGSDLCFEWPGPVEAAAAHLDRCGVAVELGPKRTFGAKGLGMSVYFRDPDGTLLEFISYAPAAGEQAGPSP
jgi:catechol 2,3-dioxygenase-like lactoylglutathione lyase family enzyme